MSDTGYVWRRLDSREREELLEWRKVRRHPWHSPPHRPNFGHFNFHISAACYRHAPYIGWTKERMDQFSAGLVEMFDEAKVVVHAWCVLPNHYHALVQTEDLKDLFLRLARFHGRTSHIWNGAERTRGRQVFCRAADRGIRSERHFWATMNYVHNNAVHQGYVKRWTEWPWSSAHAYLENVGRAEAERVWKEYPILDFGSKWDSADV